LAQQALDAVRLYSILTGKMSLVRSKELDKKYAEAVYGRAERGTPKSRGRQITFCPKCGSYIEPLSKCRKCGYESEEYLVTKKRNTGKKKRT